MTQTGKGPTKAWVLSLNSFRIWRAAAAANDRACADIASGQSLAWSFEAVVAIVLAAASTEAFINEVGECINFYRGRAEPWRSVRPELRTLADVLDQLEEEHASPQLKYLMTGVVLSAPFDRGTNPFQDFSTLVTVRNQMIHLKARDTWQQDANRSFHATWPKVVSSLKQRGLAKGISSVVPNAANETVSSFDGLQTPEMAGWACRTALNLVAATLKRLPDYSRSPVNGLKRAWSKPGPIQQRPSRTHKVSK